MKKRLVEVGGIDPYICLDSAKFYAESDMILTPGAKDELSRRGIAIVRAPKPEPVTCDPEPDAGTECAGNDSSQGLEEFVLAVAAMLKEEYGIEDPEVLRALSGQVVKTIKENI